MQRLVSLMTGPASAAGCTHAGRTGGSVDHLQQQTNQGRMETDAFMFITYNSCQSRSGQQRRPLAYPERREKADMLDVLLLCSVNLVQAANPYGSAAIVLYWSLGMYFELQTRL